MVDISSQIFAENLKMVNSFLLSRASPRLHKMISGSFRKGISGRVLLEDVEGVLRRY